jgi:hypothetical protein
MTPRDIITKHVQSVPNIRLPFARIIIDRIFADLAEYGYTITEARSDIPGAGHDEKRSDNW